MAKPNNAPGVNVAGYQVFPIEDGGLAATVTSVLDVTSSVIHTGCPATVFTLSKLSAGSATLTFDIAATAAAIDHGSPTGSLSCSGTGWQMMAPVDTTSSQLYGSWKQVSASTATWDKLVLLVLYFIEDDENFSSKKQVVNAVSNSTVGDGSAIIDVDIA